MKKLLLAVISHSPRIDFRVTQAIQTAVPSLIQLGWNPGIMFMIGSADLGGARNRLFAECYAQGFDKMLCIDSDVSWEPGAIEEIVSHDVDIVLGSYPRRHEDGGFFLKTLPRSQYAGAGLWEIAAGPTGFMCMSRSCMERMVEAYADRWYEDKEVSTGKAWNVFDFAVQDHQRMGEDFNFCRLFREIGGQVWCDPNMVLHHHGDKTYSGRLVDHLKEIGRLAVAAE